MKHNIVEVCEINDPAEVNKLLRDNWVLLEMYKNNQVVYYVLGKLKNVPPIRTTND